MKLKTCRFFDGYNAELTFENGEQFRADMAELLRAYVAPNQLGSAHIDAEWGCLEFCDGAVDIEPQSLYRFVTTQFKRAS